MSEATDPINMFLDWFEQAKKSESHNPDAMCLSTVDTKDRPSSRMILLKGVDERGFVFYTNVESRKGTDLETNQNVALCFYWKSLDRQVRVEGPVEQVSEEEANVYFATRARGSQIGAWASQQSRPMNSSEDLLKAVAEHEKRFEDLDAIPRPPHWKGFRVKPYYVEFWTEKPHRLHDRLVFTWSGNGWKTQILYP